MVQEADGIECEVIDLRTLLPWDRATVGTPLHPLCMPAFCMIRPSLIRS